MPSLSRTTEPDPTTTNEEVDTPSELARCKERQVGVRVQSSVVDPREVRRSPLVVPVSAVTSPWVSLNHVPSVSSNEPLATNVTLSGAVLTTYGPLAGSVTVPPRVRVVMVVPDEFVKA